MSYRLFDLNRRRSRTIRKHVTRPEVDALEPRRLLSGTEGSAQAYGRLPMSFETNRGQTDAQVAFLARGGGYALFLTPTEAVLRLQKPAEDGTHAGPPASDAVVRMRLVGSDPAPRLTGLDRLPGTTNYLIGDDPSRWQTDIPNYARIEARGVYPGVDLIYYGSQRQLEYDFVVAPGADPGAIKMAFPGAESATLDAEGNLVLETGGGAVVQRAPVLYQEADGVRRAVSGNFVVAGDGLVGFEVGSYDRGQPLVIDPILAYSTYLGGSNADIGDGVAVDAAGSAYVTGTTLSTNFPTNNPIQGFSGGVHYDAFVSKLNASGTALVYSTYFGGVSDEEGFGIAVDATGAAYVAGQTYSSDFPTANPLQAARGGGFSDAFVAKLNPAGTALAYSTYLGGGVTDVGFRVAVDAAGSAYVTGYTNSANFPTANPLQAALGGPADAFVAKLNPAGTALAYSTYLGGSDYEAGYGIAVDAAGSAYVTGITKSTNLPTVSPRQVVFGGGASDAFVAKLNPAGTALAYSTYLGGFATDSASSIAVDAAGSAYVTGTTDSLNFPTSSPRQANSGGGSDAYVAKLNPAGTALAYSTYLGGSGTDSGSSIAVDAAGSAYITGTTDSLNFPTSSPRQANSGGGSDVFMSKLNPAGTALAYSTYLGGSGDDFGKCVAVDAAGSAYVTGYTNSANFPTANPLQAAFGSGFSDAFVAKLASDPIIVSPPTLRSIAVTPSDPSIAVGESQQLIVTGTYSDNSTRILTGQVSWASATPSVATVTSTGLVRAVAAGTSSITARLGGAIGAAMLTVNPASTPAPTLRSIAVTPSDPSIAVGESQQLIVTGTYSDNSTRILTGQVSWASATPSVATVSDTGLVWAVAAGTSSVTARLGGVTGTVLLTVNPAPKPPVPPEVTGISGVTRTRKGITTITVDFDAALDPRSAARPASYSLALGVQKKRRLVFSRVVPVRGVTYHLGDHSVTIRLARATRGMIRVLIRGGIRAANGAVSAGNYTAVVS